MHNAAWHVLHDLFEIAWFPFAVAGLALLRSQGQDWEIVLKRTALLGGFAGILTAMLILDLDGERFIQVAKEHPLWGLGASLSLVGLIGVVALIWKTRQAQDERSIHGVFDQLPVEIDDPIRRVTKVLAVTTGVLIALTCTGLVIISMSPAS